MGSLPVTTNARSQTPLLLHRVFGGSTAVSGILEGKIIGMIMPLGRSMEELIVTDSALAEHGL